MTVALLSSILGAGGIGSFINWRQKRRKSKAEADTAEWELYDKRLDELHETVALLNETEKSHAERIASLNAALDDKTDRIRLLTDQLHDEGLKLNKANAQITRLTAETGRLRLELEKARLRLLPEETNSSLMKERSDI